MPRLLITSVGVLVLGLAPGLLLGQGGGRKRPAPSPATDGLSGAAQIFVGRLDRAQAGPVAMSEPPIHNFQLHLTVTRVLRGDVTVGQSVQLAYAARQAQPPRFAVGSPYLVSAAQGREGFQVEGIQPASAEVVAAAEQLAALPVGWTLQNAKPVSPFAVLGAAAWKAEGDFGGDLPRCSRTGRPALLAGEKVEFSVAPVPPKQSIQWTNPDGDGAYQVSVKNVSQEPLRVPALLKLDGRILWAESLVIVCQDKAYLCPGARGVSGAVEPVSLQPGQAVSTVVNALRLEGPDWPRGGYRIEFRFALGEKSQTLSFYYMSRHHDPIREALRASPATAPGQP